jgi:hypothetical protein
MWRLIFVVNLLLTSSALAAESRAELRVGVIITGKPQPKSAAAAPGVRSTMPMPRQRPAAAGPRGA